MAGFTSESVAAFRRNGWPTCVGISGRLGSEYAYVSFLMNEGRIEKATRASWAFKAGAYCGFFGMMYGGLGCGTGTFEERQSVATH